MGKGKKFLCVMGVLLALVGVVLGFMKWADESWQ